MDCGKHKNRIVLHAFSTGECEVCNIKIITGHIPCDKVCDTCSDKYKLCKICNIEIK